MTIQRFVSQLALAALAASVPVLSIATTHASFRNGMSFYGQVADAAAANRVVDVATTRSLNVAYGETVTFTDAGRQFTWTFNGLDRRALVLTDIAPAGFGRSLKVYVDQNPLTRN